MVVSRPARKELPALCVPVRVVFDCHVVTEGASLHDSVASTDRASVWIDSGGRMRIFNNARYIQSLRLPALIKGLPRGHTKCYVASAHNYMVCEQLGRDGVMESYQVYFDLYRPGTEARLVMYVQSAYVKDQPGAASRRHAKPFATLCAEKAGIVAKKPKGNKKAP